MERGADRRSSRGALHRLNPQSNRALRILAATAGCDSLVDRASASPKSARRASWLEAWHTAAWPVPRGALAASRNMWECELGRPAARGGSSARLAQAWPPRCSTSLSFACTSFLALSCRFVQRPACSRKPRDATMIRLT